MCTIPSVAIAKILLYYKFTPINDPRAVRLWQRDLCELLGLRGRIIISQDGINGTVGGELSQVKRYVRKTRDYPGFHDIDFKWSDGTGLDDAGLSLDFPKLSVKVRDEIVSFGVPDEVHVGRDGIVDGGIHLKPEEVNELVNERDDVVFFDGRNAIEAEIGRFDGAIVPNTDTTHDFVKELESGVYDDLKSKPVVTYCTGGIRCEVLSALMKHRGFQQVYQLDGGIVRYAEHFKNKGLWKGALTVFDGRESVTFGDDAAVLGTCALCGSATSRLQNCAEPSCRTRMVICEACAAKAPKCAAHALAA